MTKRPILCALALMIGLGVFLLWNVSKSTVDKQEVKNPMQNVGVLAQLPTELHYLIEPALRSGCQAEWDVFKFLDNATEQQRAELAEIAERVLKNNHYPMVLKFLGEHEITAHEESAKLYFFFGLLDYAGLKFDRVPEE